MLMPMSDPDATHRFDPHDVQWTAVKSQRLWDYISASPTYEYRNYGRVLGRAVISHVKRRGVTLRGDVLDYGCGPGFFLENLLDQGLRCHGADTSAVAVEAARRRVGDRSTLVDITLVESLPLPFDDEAFDIVFVLEVLEHMPDEELTSVLSEVRRISRPEGHVIVTTPNQENIEAETLLCPDCGGRFHRGGHVRTFDAPSLSRLMELNGFRTLSCNATTLRPRSALNFARRVLSRVRRDRAVNLIYVGR
jgi:2-polyprenyl-3-methyl-5-hydroxy-6-metoxy-1,4-benzoquinol methylase